jgi:hypothetical protein
MLMKKIVGIIGGALLGLLAGGYLGLVLGGTFLGGFDIYETIGMEGYELTTYLFGFLGLVGGAITGYRLTK